MHPATLATRARHASVIGILSTTARSAILEGMSEAVQVDVVRVFTDAGGGLGNELGIVTADVAGREQRIATQLGFSETVFLGGVADGVAAMRIFTPASELPFAGHPSVGTAWWLAQAGATVHTLSVAAGAVAVRLDGDTTWITGRAEWAPDFTMHELASAADVDALEPDSFTSGKHYVWARHGDTIRARMFAPEMGIVEDPATGAAAVRLTATLGSDLEIVQGAGCVIRTRALPDGFVEVGGRTVRDRTLSV